MAHAGPDRHKAGTVAALAFCLVPVFVFYGLLGREMRSVPMFDDYHAILYFVLRLDELHGVLPRLLYVIAAQHDEYKLIVEHAVVAVDWAITGYVHFGLFMLLGNVLVAGLGWLFWLNLSSKEIALQQRLFLFAPVAYLLFQLNYVENLDWAMCSLQTLPVLLFSIASLHFLTRTRKLFLLLACLCGWAACLSSANGFLLAPIGMILLLATRRLRAVVPWCLTFGFALSLYLYHYQRFSVPGPIGNAGWGEKAWFFLQFLGGAAENMHHFPVRNGSVLMGLLILLSLAVACKYGLYRAQPFFFCVAVWCLLSAAVVTQVRIQQGLDLSLTERYKVYSDLLLICCYAIWLHLAQLLLSTQRKRQLYAGVCAAVILFALVSDIFGYRFLAKRQRRVALGLNQFAADPAHNSPEISLTGEPFAGPEPEFARAVLVEAIRRGVYRLPTSSVR